MGVTSAMMITATVASTAMSAGQAGRGIRFNKRQERLRRKMLGRQIEEELRLAEFREAQRSQQLASKIATQMAVINGVGILGGKTTDYLRDSLEMQAAVDRARDAGSTAETINQLIVGIDQSRLTQQESTLAGGADLADSLLSGGSRLVGGGVDIKDNRTTTGSKK